MTKSSKNTILITGGAGYIGSHAVKSFLQDGHAVVILDNLSHGYFEVIDNLKKHGSLFFVNGDIRDTVALEKAFQVAGSIDTVFHFAALCSVDESVRMPELYFDNNVMGTEKLLEAMYSHGVEKIIFSSTCAVYGEAKYLPIDEAHPTNPLNPYGESKRRAEAVIENFSKLHDFKFIILRYFNVAGADSEGDIGDSKKPSLLLVQNAVRGALGIEPFTCTYPTVATKDGSPIRDYIDVNDLVDAHISAYIYLNIGGESGILNLGTGKGLSVLEIIHKVEDVLGVKIPLVKGDARQGEYAEVFANNEKAKHLLQWKPEVSLTQTILSLKKWYNLKPNGYLN